MNAPERSRTAKAAFQWDDPLLLEQQLTADERMAQAGASTATVEGRSAATRCAISAGGTTSSEVRGA